MAYTTIDDPSAYFQTALYAGNASTNVITNDGNSDLQPDWVWIKNRTTAGKDHVLYDSSRGVNKQFYTNNTNAEDSVSNGLTSFNTDGFTLGDNGGPNASGDHVAWQWKANGGTTTTNDASVTGIGDTDSVYQVNSTAKFSIVTWTGSGSGTVSIAHGLGSTPKFIIIKQRNGVNSWLVYHHKNTIVDDPHDTFLKLHLTDASSADANNYFMADTAPTSTVATFGSGTEANASGTYIGYFFDEVQGYSKFGSYTGNGSTDGTFVYTGFKPAFLIAKETGATRNWTMAASKLQANEANGGVTNSFQPNTNSAQDANERMDWLSNGFKLRTTSTTWNTSGGSYIYMAFAEHPFVSSDGVPTTAR